MRGAPFDAACMRASSKAGRWSNGMRIAASMSIAPAASASPISVSTGSPVDSMRQTIAATTASSLMPGAKLVAPLPVAPLPAAPFSAVPPAWPFAAAPTVRRLALAPAALRPVRPLGRRACIVDVGHRNVLPTLSLVLRPPRVRLPVAMAATALSIIRAACPGPAILSMRCSKVGLRWPHGSVPGGEEPHHLAQHRRGVGGRCRGKLRLDRGYCRDAAFTLVDRPELGLACLVEVLLLVGQRHAFLELSAWPSSPRCRGRPR